MALPIITADQRLAEPRGIKGTIFGKSGIGKTSLLWTLNASTTLFLDLEAGDLAVEGLEIDTLIHEEGAAQLEINLRHGDPIELADQVFMFKRTIREAALKHGIYATFMPKPFDAGFFSAGAFSAGASGAAVLAAAPGFLPPFMPRPTFGFGAASVVAVNEMKWRRLRASFIRVPAPTSGPAWTSMSAVSTPFRGAGGHPPKLARLHGP